MSDPRLMISVPKGDKKLTFDDGTTYRALVEIGGDQIKAEECIGMEEAEAKSVKIINDYVREANDIVGMVSAPNVRAAIEKRYYIDAYQELLGLRGTLNKSNICKGDVLEVPIAKGIPTLTELHDRWIKDRRFPHEILEDEGAGSMLMLTASSGFPVELGVCTLAGGASVLLGGITLVLIDVGIDSLIQTESDLPTVDESFRY